MVKKRRAKKEKDHGQVALLSLAVFFSSIDKKFGCFTEDVFLANL